MRKLKKEILLFLATVIALAVTATGLALATPASAAGPSVTASGCYLDNMVYIDGYVTGDAFADENLRFVSFAGMDGQLFLWPGPDYMVGMTEVSDVTEGLFAVHAGDEAMSKTIATFYLALEPCIAPTPTPTPTEPTPTPTPTTEPTPTVTPTPTQTSASAVTAAGADSAPAPTSASATGDAVGAGDTSSQPTTSSPRYGGSAGF